SGRNQKVRLPAGRYVTPTFSSWTTLIDADHKENSKTENNRVNILLANLTPATLIPDAAPEQEQHAKEQPAKKQFSRAAIDAADYAPGVIDERNYAGQPRQDQAAAPDAAHR